jgi:hypothetical protein
MVSSPPIWPDWWEWELDCSNPHLAKRMVDRSFNEADLRDMLERATGFARTPPKADTSSKRPATAAPGKLSSSRMTPPNC